MTTIQKPLATVFLAGFFGSISCFILHAEVPGATPEKNSESPGATAAVESDATRPVDKDPAFIAKWGNALDPDSDCKFTMDGKDLKISVPGSAHAHDFAAELKNISGPSVTQLVKGDFTVSVTVDAKYFASDETTEPTRWGYHGAGLVVLADPDNYITLQRAAQRPPGRNQFECINYELRKDAKRSWLPSAVNLVGLPDENPPFEMRLERKGKKLIASIDHSGDDWKIVWTDDLPDAWPDELRVGVVAVSSSKEPFYPVFREYSLKTEGSK